MVNSDAGVLWSVHSVATIGALARTSALEKRLSLSAPWKIRMTFILPHNPRQDRRQRADALLLEAAADDAFVRESLRIVAEARQRIEDSRVLTTGAAPCDMHDGADVS
ncbi:hypothetical protein [Burkholderia sp. Tr-20355]|nr:hypothetical protein [Burkholderia sp. Tr-20355]